MQKIKEYIKVIGCIVFVYVIFWVTGIGCPIKFLTGVSCPGCGMTRAYISLLHFDFHRAYSFHPLFWVPAVWVPIFIFKNKIPKKIYKVLVILTIIIFVAVYLFRLFDNSDIIVLCEPGNGFIFKLMCSAIKFLKH